MSTLSNFTILPLVFIDFLLRYTFFLLFLFPFLFRLSISIKHIYIFDAFVPTILALPRRPFPDFFFDSVR